MDALEADARSDLTGVAAVKTAFWQVRLSCGLSERLGRLERALASLRKLYVCQPISTDEQRELAAFLSEAKRCCEREIGSIGELDLRASFRTAQWYLGLCALRHEFRAGYDPRGSRRFEFAQFTAAVRHLRKASVEDPFAFVLHPMAGSELSNRARRTNRTRPDWALPKAAGQSGDPFA